MPLYPLPAQSGGGRLYALTGLNRGEYLRCFQRMNLLYAFPGRWKRDDRWPRKKARVAAQAVLPLLEGRTVIFVGRNVARAFEVRDGVPWFTWGQRDYRYVVIPHPSGRNHWYGKEPNRLISQAFWETLRKDLPFLGSADKMASVSYIHG